jgi:hypothetical protein
VAAGLLGIYLAQRARQHGLPPIVQFALGGLCLVSTVSLKAIQAGHPEEILGAVLCVAAVLAGLARRPVLAVVLLILALGTKQWAVVAIIPVALTLPREAIVRTTKIGLALGVALLVPFLIAGPESLWDMTRQLADVRGAAILPASIWWVFKTSHGVPDWLGLIAHPLLLAICFGVALAMARRVRNDPIARALPLLALVLLLRCVLDPVDNAYYHVPFFLAVVAADAVTGRFAATLAAALALFVTTEYGTTVTLVNAIYLTWALPFVVYLAGRAYGLDWAGLIRSRLARGPGAAPLSRSSSSAAKSQTAR